MTRISIIIPTWCEAPSINDAISSAARVADEVVVADGGSLDSTAERARSAGALVVTSARGRGVQLNEGARAASGEVLLFLHADVMLPAEARSAVHAALEDPHVVGGNFKLRFVPESPSARLFSSANDVRRRWFGIYYGDSCIFVRRAVFHALGGFKPLPLFEDFEFVSRLERAGRTHYETGVEAHVSSRRFANRPVRTLALWTALQLLYSAGVPAQRLARLYADMR